MSYFNKMLRTLLERKQEEHERMIAEAREQLKRLSAAAPISLLNSTSSASSSTRAQPFLPTSSPAAAQYRDTYVVPFLDVK